MEKKNILIVSKKTHKFALLVLVRDGNHWFIAFSLDLEGPMPHIALDLGIVYFATNETLGVKHGIFRVRVECVLCRITNTAYIESDKEVIATHI